MLPQKILLLCEKKKSLNLSLTCENFDKILYFDIKFLKPCVQILFAGLCHFAFMYLWSVRMYPSSVSTVCSSACSPTASISCTCHSSVVYLKKRNVALTVVSLPPMSPATPLSDCPLRDWTISVSDEPASKAHAITEFIELVIWSCWACELVIRLYSDHELIM